MDKQAQVQGILRQFGLEKPSAIAEATAEIFAIFADDGAVSQRWKPKEGEEYWFIWDTGQIKNKVWGTWSYHQRRWDMGNCFKTREEAEQARDKIKELLTTLSLRT